VAVGDDINVDVEVGMGCDAGTGVVQEASKMIMPTKKRV